MEQVLPWYIPTKQSVKMVLERDHDPEFSL